MQKHERALRHLDQFRGSSGSEDGVGIKITSRLPTWEACGVSKVPLVSTRYDVPGIMTSAACLATCYLLVDKGRKQADRKRTSVLNSLAPATLNIE